MSFLSSILERKEIRVKNQERCSVPWPTLPEKTPFARPEKSRLKTDGSGRAHYARLGPSPVNRKGDLPAHVFLARTGGARPGPGPLCTQPNCKTLSALRPKPKHGFSSPLRDSPLYSEHTLLRKKLHISDWPITSNTRLTRFGLASLFTTFALIAAHSSAC